MKYDTECTEAAARLFRRIHGHLLSIRERFPKLVGIDAGLADENDALLDALETGDPMEIESRLYDIDRDREAVA